MEGIPQTFGPRLLSCADSSCADWPAGRGKVWRVDVKRRAELILRTALFHPVMAEKIHQLRPISVLRFWISDALTQAES